MNKIALAEVNNGAAERLFDEELERIIQNVNDVNTDAKEPRKLTLEFTFNPHVTREMGSIDVKCKSKLAPTKSFTGGYVQSDGCFFECNTEQPELDFDNVTSIGEQ